MPSCILDDVQSLGSALDPIPLLDVVVWPMDCILYVDVTGYSTSWVGCSELHNWLTSWWSSGLVRMQCAIVCACSVLVDIVIHSTWILPSLVGWKPVRIIITSCISTSSSLRRLLPKNKHGMYPCGNRSIFILHIAACLMSSWYCNVNSGVRVNDCAPLFVMSGHSVIIQKSNWWMFPCRLTTSYVYASNVCMVGMSWGVERSMASTCRSDGRLDRARVNRDEENIGIHALIHECRIVLAEVFAHDWYPFPRCWTQNR